MLIGKTTNLKRRVRDHFARNSNSRLLGAAIAKYGEKVFLVEILYEGIIPELLGDFEIQAIKEYNTKAPHGYNLTDGGEGALNPSEETRQKMSLAQRGENHWNFGREASNATRQKISQSSRGRKQSTETRKKRSIAWSGKNNPMYGKPGTMKGRKHSPEAKRRNSEAKKGENNPNFGKKAICTNKTPNIRRK